MPSLSLPSFSVPTAASLLVAVGLGWTASSVVDPGAASRTERARAAAVRPAPARVPAVSAASVAAAAPAQDSTPAAHPARDSAPVHPAARAPRRAPEARPALASSTGTRTSPEPLRNDDSLRAAMLAVLDPAPAVELSQLESSRERGQEFDGMWRTMSWDGAQAEAGRQLPHIDGLPVVKVQIQAGDQGNRPVMVVAQQLSSGQVIQTIEGPAAGVSQLLARRNMSDPDKAPPAGDTTGGSLALDQTMAMQLGDRMLAITAALPSDSLRAMIRRLNAEMRSKRD